MAGFLSIFKIFHQETYFEFQIHHRIFVAMAQIQKTNIKKK